MDKILMEKINNCSWADWRLDKIEIDYECIIISVSNESEVIVKFSCNNFIGLSIVGHWDESVIESISIEDNGCLIKDSIETIKRLNGDNPLKGGGIKDINDEWYQMNIKLIDGIILKFAFRDIEDVTHI
ncbi:MAG TPA: hypothetical protein DCP51_02150 [Clostridiales bacterium]|nr:hypothetical protein [Clostridiales bacterium]